MKKINQLFCFIFLIFLFLCTVPTISQSIYWLRDHCTRQYDEIMRKYNTRYYKPADPAFESVYKEQKELLDEKFPSRTHDASNLRIAQKFLKHLLPRQKDFEDQMVAAFPFRIIFSEISMAFRKFIGMKIPIEYSTHYLRPDGSLGILPGDAGKFYPLENILNAEKIAKENNARFHVIVRPENILDETTVIYRGLQDRSNILIDERVRKLEQAGVSVWDMRRFWNRLPNRNKLFFRTDHHWNVYGALKGAEILASMLNDNYHLNYDLKGFNPSIFQKISFKKIFLGSSGKILTTEYVDHSNLDDFDILIPCCNTDFSLENSQLFSVRGDFSIFLFDNFWSYDHYKSFIYAVWLNGDIPEVRIINHRIPKEKGKKILFIKDSFCNSMVPYLALQTREIILVDPRFRNSRKLRKIIQREKPDFIFWIFSLIPFA